MGFGRELQQTSLSLSPFHNEEQACFHPSTVRTFHSADKKEKQSKRMWLWEETSRESLTISCIQESFNASKDIQGWVDTVNSNLLTQISSICLYTGSTRAQNNKQTNITRR